MRIPKLVFVNQFGNENDIINISNVSENLSCESDALLAMNK
jgi:hypothetical protein